MLEDLRANGWGLRPCCMVATYRAVHFCSVWCKESITNNLWVAPMLVMYHPTTKCLLGYEIQAVASIGRRSITHHGYGVVINKDVVAGDDFILHYGVTIGNFGANDSSCPAIGNGAELGANVTLLGDVAIDDNVTIGAGSVMVDSTPDNTLIVGEKARVKAIK